MVCDREGFRDYGFREVCVRCVWCVPDVSGVCQMCLVCARCIWCVPDVSGVCQICLVSVLSGLMSRKVNFGPSVTSGHDHVVTSDFLILIF
jgi:hypothetical protein